MTKNKRYIDGEEECVEDQFLIDTETDEYFFISHGLDKIVDKLNEQSDKITKQAIQIDFLKDENKHMKQVLEENRQLKKEIKNGNVE